MDKTSGTVDALTASTVWTVLSCLELMLMQPAPPGAETSVPRHYSEKFLFKKWN